jgi:hypothetical protein
MRLICGLNISEAQGVLRQNYVDIGWISRALYGLFKKSNCYKTRHQCVMVRCRRIIKPHY